MPTDKEQAKQVEHVLRGDPQCWFCERWMPVEKMRSNGRFGYACKGHVEGQNCLKEIWKKIRKPRP